MPPLRSMASPPSSMGRCDHYDEPARVRDCGSLMARRRASTGRARFNRSLVVQPTTLREKRSRTTAKLWPALRGPDTGDVCAPLLVRGIVEVLCDRPSVRAAGHTLKSTFLARRQFVIPQTSLVAIRRLREAAHIRLSIASLRQNS